MEVERINVLGVPVDVLAPQNLEKVLFELYENAGTKQIIFLSVWDLLRARKNQTYMDCLKNAALILPTSKSIIKGAVFLKRTRPYRYNPFTALMNIMTCLETRYKTLYLLGGHKSSLMGAQRNIHATYPGLHIVGRYVGYFPKSTEKDVVEAIYKANPSLVLVGDGIRKSEQWVHERRNQFGSSFFICSKDAIDIISLRKKRVSNQTFEKGNEIWFEIFRNPVKICLIFPYIKYKLLLIIWRLFKK